MTLVKLYAATSSRFDGSLGFPYHFHRRGRLSMHAGFTLFGLAHFFILGAVLVAAGVLSFVHRTYPMAGTRVRCGFVAIMIVNDTMCCAWRVSHHSVTFPDHMPFELCDASMALTVLSLLLMRPLLFDLAYYWALAGASMALLTPNLQEPFPSLGAIEFFVSHGLTVAGVLYLLWSGQASPRPGSVMRALIGVNLFAIFVGSFDYLYKTNYLYLRLKPSNPSLLDFLGPWPIYIAGTEVVALCFFLLLYLPVRYARKFKAAEVRTESFFSVSVRASGKVNATRQHPGAIER